MAVVAKFLFLLSGLRVLLAVHLELEDTGNLDLDAPDVIDYKDPCKAGRVLFINVLIHCMLY